MPFNIAYIRSSNNKAQKRYIRYGTKLFLDALKAQAVENPDPKIMENAYVKFYMDVFPDAAKRGYYQVRENDRTKDFSIDSFFTSVWREWIREWIRTNLAQLITEVNNTTRNIINEVLQTAIEDGLNPFQTQKLLQKIVGNRARALAIATTESTRANNMGQERSADDYQSVTGRKLYKVWIHSGNPREPRQSHIFAQGKPIPKEQPFEIEGVYLRSPGNAVQGQDRKQVASQVINCKCTVAYIGERVARQRFPDAFANQQPVKYDFPEPIFNGDFQTIERYKTQTLEIIKELGIKRQLEFDFKSQKQGLGGDVSFVLNKEDGTYRMGNKVTVSSKSTDEEFIAFLKHELRHIYQSDFKGFMVKNGYFYFDGEKSISISTYQKILRGAEKKDLEMTKSYLNLPWEIDADDFAGIERTRKSLFVNEYFTVDLIQLPIELQIIE